MSDEIVGGAEEFASAVEFLRHELDAVASAVAPDVEPRVQTRTDDRRTTRGAMGKRYWISLHLPDTSYETAVDVAREVLVAAGWTVSIGEAHGDRPFLKATKDRFEVSVGAEVSTLRISGRAPDIWISSHWLRPPPAATPETLRPGHQLCGECDGWGTCYACEGLGFYNGRACPWCGLGTTCPSCEGTGQEPVGEQG
ncbi:hypothetical protein [Streptomyces sp. NPDC001927]